MRWPSPIPPIAAAAAIVVAAAGCRGIDSDLEYPRNATPVRNLSLTPEGKANPPIEFNGFRIKPEVCRGFDTHPIVEPLNQEDFNRFLVAQGAKDVIARRARSNLYWYEFPFGDGSKRTVRLRLAVLDSPGEAAADLRDSLHLHGPGWWGVRRSNLAILAPKTGLRDAVAFAIQHRLVCWGMMTYAGYDDAYVVPGPYAEF